MYLNNLLFTFQSEYKIKKRAARVILNLTKRGNRQHVDYVIHEGAFPPLCALLAYHDYPVMEVVTDIFQNMVKFAGPHFHELAIKLEECIDTEQLIQLQFAVL